MPSEQIHQDIAGELDRALLAILREGEYLTDGEGNAVLDDKGRPVKRRPTAATLNVIRARLKDCGVTADAKNPASPVGQLVEQMRKDGHLTLAMPPLDIEGEDRATA